MSKENNITSIKKAPNKGSDLAWVSHIYFLGIGGIGMSALAKYFHAKGKQVGGYDKTQTTIINSLEALGIAIHFKDDIKYVNPIFLNPEHTLVVYTPAIPDTLSELHYFKTHAFNILKRSQVLGLITKNTFCLAVAGTHGKTTTTSILGHLMHECRVPVTAFLGGISENYNSNLILTGTNVSVIEADEFDRSFLTLSPNLACITSMDADHLDIYGDASELHNAFVDFSKRVKPNGKLFVKKELPLNGITFGIENNSDYTIQNININQGTYIFDIKTPSSLLKNLQFNLPGKYNLLNALVAFAMALEYGCNAQSLIKALATYKGVKRRFTYHIKTESRVFIDDYAHHPEEINALYLAVRDMHPNKEILAIFQPHLFSRTRDFADAFAKSLSQFDKLILLDIYPARELPIPGVTSAWLLGKINNKNKALLSKQALLKALDKTTAQVILTIGAGDIGAYVKHIKKQLNLAS